MSERPITTAMILAGGLGTRLRESVPDLPKPLAPVAGRPFLEFIFAQLQRAGVRRVILCTGHGADAIWARYGTRWGELELMHSVEAHPLGTGGALGLAAELLDTPWTYVLNGDSYCQIDWRSFARTRPDQAAVTVVHVENAGRYGRVSIDSQARITTFSEKGSEGPGWINAGVYRFHRAMLAELPTDDYCSLERDVLPTWVTRPLIAHRAFGRFIDIGTPASYEDAQHVFAQPDAAPTPTTSGGLVS
jgi:D-glycero-alpha-D-manno-heptose 1-phosphate guanylyltransferase